MDFFLGWFAHVSFALSNGIIRGVPLVSDVLMFQFNSFKVLSVECYVECCMA